MSENGTNPETEALLDDEVNKKVKILGDVFTPKGQCVVARSPHFKEIMEKILRGESSRDIEAWLIQSKGENFRISHHAIWAYRRKYIPDGVLFDSNYIKERYKEKIKQLDEVIEMEHIIVTQVTRIAQMHEEEAREGRLHPTLFREMATLKDLLKASAELKMELGLLKKVAAQHEVKFKGLAERLPKGVSLEGLTKVLALAEAVKRKKKGDQLSAPNQLLH